MNILFILFRWVVGIWLVMKLTSDDLLDRLKKKGTREPAYTKALIIKKLNDDDDDVATTSLKVRIIQASRPWGYRGCHCTPPDFCKSVNPIASRETDYTPSSILASPVLQTFLWSCYIVHSSIF